MRPLLKVWEYHTKSPSQANIHIKILRAFFSPQSPLRCSWLCQIGNKSLASLYTSSERTVNEMWGRLGCGCLCVCMSLSVCAWQFSLIFLVFLLLCISIVVENDKSVFVSHWARQIVCMEHLNEFDYESCSCTFPPFVRFGEWECLTVVLTWRMCRPSAGIHAWDTYGLQASWKPFLAPCMVFSE